MQGSLKKRVITSGGYSNLRARGKNFQKLMLSEKKKRSDLGLHIFLPKSRCSPKKKKKGLHFHLLSVFPILLPKSRCSLKKKKVFISISSLIFLFFSSFASPNIHYWSSLQTSLRFLIFRPKFTIFSKITQKNGSSSRIGLRFHPEHVIFLVEFNHTYLIAQKFVMQFLKIWSCNA